MQTSPMGPSTQSIPEGQALAPLQRWSSQRRVDGSQTCPRGHGFIWPQPGWQSVSPEHAHRRGRHTVPGPQVASLVQVEGWLLQMPHRPWSCSGRRQINGRPQVESSLQHCGCGQPNCGHWKACAVLIRHCAKRGSHEH
jgi:hypothetical protein